MTESMIFQSRALEDLSARMPRGAPKSPERAIRDSYSGEFSDPYSDRKAAVAVLRATFGPRPRPRHLHALRRILAARDGKRPSFAELYRMLGELGQA